MDVDPTRLDSVHHLAVRYAQERGVDLRLEKTLDRRAALAGTDFVVNTALAAGHERLREGWQIALRHGYRLPGSFHVLYDEAFWVNYHQLRLFESLTEDILDLCPKAWHLMIANPVIAGVTHLGRRYPDANVVGLCHGYTELYQIADLLGLKKEEMTFEVVGVNHHIWLTSFRWHGADAYPMLDRWIEERSADHWAKRPRGVLSRKKIDLYRKYGLLPIGDTAGWSGASWPWWYHTDQATGDRWDERPEIGWNDYFTAVGAAARDIERIARDSTSPVSGYVAADEPDDLVVPFIESLACDVQRVFIANTLNDGEHVPGIPRDFEVEAPVLVGGRGVQGIRTRGLPRAILAHILRDRIAPIEMELDAFVHGSRDRLVDLVLMDRGSASVEQVSAFVDEILALPYHGDMRSHYR
jgi:alpha-galactosidase